MEYPTARWGDDEIVSRFASKASDDYFESEKFLLQQASSFYRDHGTLKLLDIGCATGNLLLLLKELNIPIEYKGIDIQEKMISAAKSMHKNGQFDCVSIESYIKASEEYDCIHCIGVLQHILDPYQLIRDILSKSALFCIFDVKSWAHNEDIVDIKRSRCGTDRNKLLYNILSEERLEDEIQKSSSDNNILRISSTCQPNPRVKLEVDDKWKIRNTTYLIRKMI